MPGEFARGILSGAILAGGRGQRMGGMDKGLLPLLGRLLIDHAIEILRPQVGKIIINANRHLDRYAMRGFPVVADGDGGYAGPLAGVARVIENVTTPYLLVIPCDMPFLPANLASMLLTGLTAHGGEAAVACGAGRIQPLCILLDCGVRQNLRRYREAGGSSVRDWVTGLRHCVVEFIGPPKAFVNINGPDQLSNIAGLERRHIPSGNEWPSFCDGRAGY